MATCQVYLVGLPSHKNLGDAVEEYLKRKGIQIPATEPQETGSSAPPQDSHAPQASEPAACESEQTRNQKQDLWEQAHALHQQGYGVRTIAKLLGNARNTMRRYLKMEDGWQAALRGIRRSLLDPYRDYLLTRWIQGEHNGNQLIREIRSQGYRGCDTLVREFTTRLRKMYPDVTALPRTSPTLQPGAPLPLELSQVPVEGTVNKVKVHKRLMYGRASFPLLRRKMLHCS